MKDTKFKKVNIIGDQYCSIFIHNDTGKEEVIPITKKEYFVLSKKNAIQPTLKNHIWKFSIETPKYDTETGYLEKDQYAEVDDKQVVINIGRERKFETPTIMKKGFIGERVNKIGKKELREFYKITV